MRARIVVAATVVAQAGVSADFAAGSVLLLSQERQISVSARYAPSDSLVYTERGPLNRQLYTSYAPYSSASATQTSTVTANFQAVLIRASGSGNQYGSGLASSTYLVRFAVDTPTVVNLAGTGEISFGTFDPFAARGAGFEVVIRSLTDGMDVYRQSRADVHVTAAVLFSQTLLQGEYELYVRAYGSGGGTPFGSSGYAGVDLNMTVPSPSLGAVLLFAAPAGLRRRR